MTPLSCKACGVQIHADTAKWNEGLCMRCAKRRPPGAEERLSVAAQKYVAEHANSKTDEAEAAYATSLRQRVHALGGSIDLLPSAERNYLLLSRLSIQLREGGIFSFFDNSPGDHYLELLELVRVLRLDRVADGLTRAKAVLFEEAAVPTDLRSRRRLMPTNRHGEPRREIRKPLEKIDEDTRGAEEEIEEKMREIARSNGLY